jgi:hypothetical protein
MVDKLGEDPDGRLAVGDRVIAYVIPFGPHDGSYAEKAVVAAASVVPAPLGASFPEASTLLLNATTARLAAAWSPAGETVRNEPSTQPGMAGQPKSPASSGRVGAGAHGPQPAAHRRGHHGLPRLLPQFAVALPGELARNLGMHDSSWSTVTPSRMFTIT